MNPVLPISWLRGIALALIGIKLLLMAAVPPFMDETYYWLWGQHPALSYFDHPPLNAWVQGVSAALLGWTQLGLRLPVALSFAADVVLLWLFARHLAPARHGEMFWLSSIVMLASPIFLGLTSVALPDHLLICFGLAATYGFVRYLDAWAVDRVASPVPLYLGAVALGLAGLSKYNAAFLGLALLGFVVANPRFRAMLTQPHIWLAGVLAILLQAPVLIWNLQQGLVSFEFILGARHGGQSNAAGLSGLLGFVLGFAGLLGPFLLIPLFRFLVARGQPDPGAGFARWGFWISTVAILLLSLVTDVLFHWNLTAYIAVLPFLALLLQRRWVLWGHVGLGVLAAGLLAVNYLVLPLRALNDTADQTSAWSYGWDQIASQVAAAKAEHAPAFIATTDYALAGQLGFALRDPDVTSLSPRMDQFDFWFDPAAHRGQRGLVIADWWRPVTPEIEQLFATLVPIGTVSVMRWDRALGLYTIYLGEGYTPPEASPE